MHKVLICLLVCGWVVLAGCAGSGKSPGQKVLRAPKPPPAVPAPVETAIDPALQERAQAELQAAFGSNNPVLRANAVEATQRTLGSAGQDRILAALKDPRPIVRFAGTLAAGELKLAAAKPYLVKLLSDESTRVRIGTRFALHKLGDYSYSHGLEETAADSDPRIRSDTVMVLGMLGEPSAMRILRDLMRDPDPGVRLQVAEAMWRLGDRQALERLVAGTLSGYASDQIISIQALAAPRDRRVMEHIRGKLTSDYPEVALTAASAMGQLGSDEGYGVALQNITAKDVRQRTLAALAFGNIGRPDAQPHLGPLLNDADPNVRLAAATALLQLGKGPSVGL